MSDKKIRRYCLDDTFTRLSLLDNGQKAKWSFNRGNREKTDSPFEYFGLRSNDGVMAALKATYMIL